MNREKVLYWEIVGKEEERGKRVEGRGGKEGEKFVRGKEMVGKKKKEDFVGICEEEGGNREKKGEGKKRKICYRERNGGGKRERAFCWDFWRRRRKW